MGSKGHNSAPQDAPRGEKRKIGAVNVHARRWLFWRGHGGARGPGALGLAPVVAAAFPLINLPTFILAPLS